MSRKSDYKSFYELVAIAVALITASIKFLTEVHKRGLWLECIISVSIICGFNYLLYYLWDTKVLPFPVFGWSCLVTFIIFCLYWSCMFNSNSVRQFSPNQLKRNSGYWAEQAWWWGLDGWQFEEEVAKYLSLMVIKQQLLKAQEMVE